MKHVHGTKSNAFEVVAQTVWTSQPSKSLIIFKIWSNAWDTKKFNFNSK
jgi:hypothetical protein